MRVLIVDDEAPTRVRLRQMLTAHADVDVVGEAETGPQAIEQAERLRPDVMLLDVQMPGCSGIDVAACLPAPRPHVIFCTAYDQYAIDAFELDAVDYLLKPVSRARLAQSLDRVRSRGAAGDNSNRGLDDAPRRLRSDAARFLVRSGARYVVVEEGCVLFFGTEGSLTLMVTESSRYWMDPSLNDLEKRLDPARFFRVSRAALVKLSAVTEVVPESGGGGAVRLSNGQRLEVSRRRFRDLMEALSG